MGITATSGPRIWTVDADSDDLWKIDTRSNTDTGERYGLGSDWTAQAMSRSGDSLYVSRGKSGSLSKFDTDTGRRLAGLVELGHAPSLMALGPDKRLYVLREVHDKNVLTALDAAP